MVAVCEKFGSENVTSIVPLGAADTREQSIAEAVEEMSNVRHSESK
jgi:hypothetical protein